MSDEPSIRELADRLAAVEAQLRRPRPGPCGVISRPLPLQTFLVAQAPKRLRHHKQPRVCVLDADHDSDLHRSQDETMWTDGQSWTPEQYQRWRDEKTAPPEAGENR